MGRKRKHPDFERLDQALKGLSEALKKPLPFPWGAEAPQTIDECRRSVEGIRAWLDQLARAFGWTVVGEETYFQPESVLFALFASEDIGNLAADIPEYLIRGDFEPVGSETRNVMGMRPGHLKSLKNFTDEEIRAERYLVDEYHRKNNLPPWSDDLHALSEEQDRALVWRTTILRDWKRAHALVTWVKSTLDVTAPLHHSKTGPSFGTQSIKANYWRECKIILGVKDVTATLASGGKRVSHHPRRNLRLALEGLGLGDPTDFGKGNRETARGVARDLRAWLRTVFVGPTDDPLNVDPDNRGWTAAFKVVVAE